MDYTQILSQKAQEIKPSGIRKFFNIAAEMEDVISLSIGEPDFKTPWSIRYAGIRSLEQGKTFYTANAGMKALKAEVANYLRRRFSLSYDGDSEVLVTVGGSEAIDLCIRAFVDPGDEVLVPEPCFVAYAPIAELAHARVVPIPVGIEENFKLTGQVLREKLTEKTKLLVLPFPNNPTGAVLEQEDLEEIAQVLQGTNVMVLSDEIYAELTYGGRHTSIASLPGMRERTVVVNGFSKAYAMTGWRLGYAAGPAEVIKQMTKIHQFAIMCAPTTSQYAAIEALKNCDEEIEHMKEEYNIRRRFCVNTLERLGLPCGMPAGTFYVFPSIRSTGLSSDAFCERLLYGKKVAVVPGSAFGASGEGHVRISYSYSVNHLVEAFGRIEEFLQELGVR